MPRIVTGQISYASAVRDTTDETYTHGSRAYFGSEGGASGIENIYVLYFAPVAGDLQDVASNEIRALRIRLTLKKKTTVATDSEFVYKLYSSEQSWYSPKSLYDVVDGGDAYTYAWVDFANTLEAQEIVISLTGTAAYYAAQYGFSMANLTLGDIVEVTSYTMEADVSDRYVPPIVSLKDGFGEVADGKYWHNPANQFTLQVDYSQEAGEEIEQIRLVITLKNGTTRTIYGKIGSDSVDVPDYLWENLPEYGTLRIDVTSAAGVASETIEMPFEVAQYNIRYTSHTSGTIVESNEDITVSWQAVWPDTAPALSGMTAPTEYIYYVWYDETKTTAGTYTAEHTHIIPAEDLEGHRSVHVAIREVYGDYGTRKLENAPVLNLYIQQVAGIGGVTVSPEEFAGGTYYPRITVSWESSGQTAYQVKVGETYNSGTVWGTEQSHAVQKMLDNGTYAVQVRVQDTSGAWGAWTEPIWITIDTALITKGSITAVNLGNKVDVTINLDGAYEYSAVLLYRNGVMIAQLEVADIVTYTDITANGTAVYFARCVSAYRGSYRATEKITVNAVPETDGIMLEDGTWIPLKYSMASPRRYQSSVSEENYAKYYAGREYPVYMRSGRKSREVPLAYGGLKNELADRIEAVAGEMVVYKNRLGQVIHGVLNSVNAYRGRISCEVSFVISQADHTDEVPYKWTEE